jgi:hypothetical protein
MREIKFRCWDKIEKKMWIPIINEKGIPCKKHPLTRLLIVMDGELLDPIMQYTGLKDKNGKEIYEGDIVKNSSGELGEIKWINKISSFEVDMFILGRQCMQDNLEIIGNIYEDPELLTK